MVVAKLNLEALANQLQLQEPGQKIYNNISTLLEESTAEVRDLSHSMMPQDFALTGLADTIKNFLDKIVSPNLHIYFNASGNFTFIEENTALMVYRVVQECVQNVLKHAQATKLHVTVNAENNELDITLEDNGIGFNINNPNLVNSNGLKNIQSRILYLNGKVDINSTPGNGTMIAFYIPLHQQ
jgi:signal transduction histidine kinase